MKFRCVAVDEGGRIVREVLRADSEEDARELLLGENLFPKQLEPVPEETKVTWVSRRRVQENIDKRRVQTGDGETGTERPLVFGRTTLLRAGGGTEGTLSVFAGGEVVFEPRGGEKRIYRAQDVEAARLGGFPLRRLRLYLLNGELFEFTAGWFVASGAMRTACRALAGAKAAGKK